MDIWLIIKYALIPLSLLATYGIKRVFTSYKDDNPIEEIAEKAIEEETGISIDLTPESEEEDGDE